MTSQPKSNHSVGKGQGSAARSGRPAVDVRGGLQITANVFTTVQRVGVLLFNFASHRKEHAKVLPSRRP